MSLFSLDNSCHYCQALQPIYIPTYNIYDIFHNDDNTIVIIIPQESAPPTIHYISPSNDHKHFSLHICNHKHTYVYTLATEYEENIKLSINGRIIETKINKYPCFENEYLFSTIVKNEDEYIRQWIDFHLILGIQRFIIYDNNEEDTLSSLLCDYMIKNQVILIRWTYPYILKQSGLSGQTTQQNHSIYAFRKSKYIGLFDIDEYINIQQKTTIPLFLDHLIAKENIDINNTGSFKLSCKNFYNPTNLPTDGSNFLNIFTCRGFEKGREKNIVIPKHITTYSVHIITSGHKMYEVNTSDAYFNHYIFLNKSDRGKDETDLSDNSILLHVDLSKNFM
jgi:hypothetical protein